MNIQLIKKKHDQAISDKTYLASKYNEIADYTLPFYKKYDPTNKTISKNGMQSIPVILDSSDSFCNFIAASLLGAEMVTSELDRDTFELIQEAEKTISLSKFDEVSELLQNDTKRAHKFLTASNMTQAILKSLPEAVNLGTGCIKMIENKGIANPWTFKHITTSSFAFATDTLDKPNYVFVNLGNFDREQLLNQFPTLKLKNLPKEGKTIKTIETIAVEDDKYFQIISDDAYEHILYQAEIEYNPYIVYRFKHFSNTAYGKGIGFALLDNFRKLARYRELEDLSAEQAINPSTTYFGDPNSYANLDIRPGTLSYGGNAPNYELVQNQLVGNLVPLDTQIQRLEQEIQNSYLANPLGQYQDRAQTTATEVEQRIELFRQRFTSTYTNLSDELLKPLFFNALSIMSKKGMLRFDTEYIDLVNVIYTNEITKAEQRDTANRLINYKTTMMQTNPQYESVVIDPLEYATKVGDLLGIDKSVFSTKDELEMQQQIDQITQANSTDGFGNTMPEEGF